MMNTILKQEESMDTNEEERLSKNDLSEKGDIDHVANCEGTGSASTGDDESYANMSRKELLEVCKSNNSYISGLESKLANLEAEILASKNADTYQKQRDPTYREKILSRKLSLKDQEIQDYATQVNELKAAQIPALATLKSTLLDPAINIIVQKLKNELTATRASLEETQNELNAWKFTPDSNTGKRLMAKCRLLHQENEELGKMISSGRVAKLEGELALQKNFSEEVRKSQLELDELLQDLDEDVEGMQGTIYYLQQELKKSKEKIADLEAKNERFRKLVDNSSSTGERDCTVEGDTTILDDDQMTNVDKKNNLTDDFNAEDESSNDSSCLILKVNPEEEYESMFNDEITKTEESKLESKTKRGIVNDGCEEILSKKSRRLSDCKKEADED